MRKPAEIFPPGEFIQDELDARNWTDEDLAYAMTLPSEGRDEYAKNLFCVQFLIACSDDSRVLMGDDTASRLGRAFGTGKELWINVESQWREYCKQRN